MAIYQGTNLIKNYVSLRPPNIEEIKLANQVNFTDLNWDKWRELSLTDKSVFYFAIHFKNKLVGEIFLHDMDLIKKEALLGYHIFNPHFRGKGIGAVALYLLQKFVKENMDLDRLIIITGENNLPSQKIAEKTGFINKGLSREDPKKIVYEWVIK